MLGFSKLKRDFPWVQFPLISNAPMGGIATSKLASAVTRSGGLGQIGFTGAVRSMQTDMEEAKSLLKDASIECKEGILPIGIGIVAAGGSPQAWLPLFSTYKPAMVWLSFADTERFALWAQGIRKASPDTKVWIQVGSVSTALEAAKMCHPDALVLQGIDAGGHGHEEGASIVTLLPEVADTLQDNGLDDIPLVAAGGIMDGRGTAAAITLGAAAVVMGTGFLGAEECDLEPEIRDVVFQASDGGQSTARSRVWDEVWGPNPWPETYNGRCLKNAIYENMESGLSIEEVRMKLREDYEKARSDPTKVRDVYSMWAGTGIGMVKKLEKAADIVGRVQTETTKLLRDTYGCD